MTEHELTEIAIKVAIENLIPEEIRRWYVAGYKDGYRTGQTMIKSCPSSNHDKEEEV